jgi:lysophospholipase L1-like esterase
MGKTQLEKAALGAAMCICMCGGLQAWGAEQESVEVPELVALTGKDSPLRSGEVIAFVGDSITQQGTRPGGYVWLIEHALAKHHVGQNVKLIKAGVSGHRVPHVQARLDRDVLAHKPTVVFIYIGINDVWHSERDEGTPKDQYESGLRDLLKRTLATGAAVVLATPSVIGEKTDGTNKLDEMLDEYCHLSRKVAGEMGVTLCDLRAAFLAVLKEKNPDNRSANLLTRDGVHLNAAGNRLVAEEAAQAIAQALRQRNLQQGGKRPPRACPAPTEG